ncbi:carboxymuconolactone decarboxylase family protein [Kribbella catacumbae]|uniref:carboxymuconolactone decarboxylase family protein n=1 Tax=Kribbella catacumbae TaxID=460086 RepID=UPI000374EE4D|nr:carboxymuconolactone decarboxylase family protein [Kribbella catacumbae]
MPRIEPLTPAEAPGKSAELLSDIIERRGSVGNMVATMAHSPALLQGYLDFSRAMKRTKLPRPLSEKISIALQEWIGCDVCQQAHADAGRSVGLTETDITLARQAISTDDRETPLLALAVQVLTEPSAITDDTIEAAKAAGWSDRILAEVVGIVVLNQLTGSFNLLAGLHLTPVN